MKNYIPIIILILFAVSSCKKGDQSVEEALESDDLELIRETRDSRQSEADKAREDVKQLEARIAELDSTVQNYPVVTAVTIQDTLFNHYIEVQGSVKTKDDTQVYPEMSGQMTNLYVNEGDYVRKGQLIATVDDGGLKQQIAQQEVQLELARTTYERQKRLWDQNIGSEMQYLEAKNRVEALEEGIAAQRQQLKKVNVYAPFNGSVEDVITQQGEVVSPGATPIIRLVGLGSMYVEAEVPETYLPSVSRGTNTVVNLSAIDVEYESTVRRINNTINPSSRSFIIEVGVPDNRLIKPNLIATLRINDYSNENAILIPTDVIDEDAAGQEFVFVVDEMMEDSIATVKKVVIETGETNKENLIEVKSGLQANQRVIGEGSKSLSEGDKVEVLDYQPEE